MAELSSTTRMRRLHSSVAAGFACVPCGCFRRFCIFSLRKLVVAAENPAAYLDQIADGTHSEPVKWGKIRIHIPCTVQAGGVRRSHGVVCIFREGILCAWTSGESHPTEVSTGSNQATVPQYPALLIPINPQNPCRKGHYRLPSAPGSPPWRMNMHCHPYSLPRS